MRFNFLQLSFLEAVSFPEVVCDNVVSDDVTITSSLPSDVIDNIRNKFGKIVKRVLRMDHAKTYETVSILLKLCRENCGLFFRTRC